MHSDPIADLLTRIRNGAQAKMTSVDIPHSKIKVEIVKILEAEGYIGTHEVVSETKFPTIRVQLRYKPSGELKPIRSGLATRIISTSQGLMTDREARKRRVGGEVLCEVY